VSSKGSRNYIQFLGEVRQPGEYPFKNDSDFFDYLIKAGGPTERADMNNIALLRNNGDQREMLNFDITKADKIPALNPGDTLIVHSDSPSALEKDTRVVGGFAGIISALATVVVLILAV
jgi:protein involved in polysaccharide export with SLBB domain